MHYCDSKATCYTVDSVSTLQEPYLILKYWNLEFPRARMSWTWDKKEYESPPVIEPMAFRTPVGCSNHWATKGELGHIQGSCITCVLPTARRILWCRNNNWKCCKKLTSPLPTHVWESETVLDSGFQAMDFGFQVLDSYRILCQWNLPIPDSNR